MKVIVATDGSQCSNRAIDYIAQRPWQADDVFITLMVVEPIPAGYAGGWDTSARAGYESELYSEATRITAEGAEKIRNQVNSNVEAKVVTGTAAEKICEFAKEADADLILMGTHGRRGLQHFLLGSVAEEVLKHSPCSVEVIKEKERRLAS